MVLIILLLSNLHFRFRTESNTLVQFLLQSLNLFLLSQKLLCTLGQIPRPLPGKEALVDLNVGGFGSLVVCGGSAIGKARWSVCSLNKIIKNQFVAFNNNNNQFSYSTFHNNALRALQISAQQPISQSFLQLRKSTCTTFMAHYAIKIAQVDLRSCRKFREIICWNYTEPISMKIAS